MKKKQLELVVEILQKNQDWGREVYFRAAQSEERSVEVLCLGNAQKPDRFELYGGAIWLELDQYASDANLKLRELYPKFLHQLSESTGLLDITLLNNTISSYWFMPISEMSALRNPLISQFYGLLLLDCVMMEKQYNTLKLVTDDYMLEIPVRQIASRRGAFFQQIQQVKPLQDIYKSRWDLRVAWWTKLLHDIMFWFIVRVFKIGQLESVSKSSSYAFSLTIFPTLWQKVDETNNLKNRALGDWPDELKQSGHKLIYVGMPSIKFSKLLHDVKNWRLHMTANGVVLIQALLTMPELIACYSRFGRGAKMSTWLQLLSSTQVLFDNINVNELVQREFLQEIWSPSIAQCSMIARAASNLVTSIEPAALAVYPFEFQPIEKAFNLGMKLANPHLPVVGIQTSIIGTSHLGYHFLPEQVSMPRVSQSSFAPLPDFVATYGTVSQSILAKTLGNDRVILTGPIRYPYLRVDSSEDRLAAEIGWKDKLKLHPDAMFVLLALPSLEEETKIILNWAFHVGKMFPKVFFLIRFHYWAMLDNILQTYSNQTGFSNYYVASGDLHNLLLASRVIITGASSIAVEAMASGCMPIVYRTPGQPDTLSPISDVAEGSFFYTNESQLQFALQECLGQTNEYFMRRSQWSFILDKLCYGLDGKASSRLYRWLDKRGVFNNLADSDLL